MRGGGLAAWLPVTRKFSSPPPLGPPMLPKAESHRRYCWKLSLQIPSHRSPSPPAPPPEPVNLARAWERGWEWGGGGSESRKRKSRRVLFSHLSSINMKTVKAGRKKIRGLKKNRGEEGKPMSSIETRPWAQPHVFSVPPYSFQITSMCQREVGGSRGAQKKKKKRGNGPREEVERLKSGRSGIGGDQRLCWTVERICVTAISKTITQWLRPRRWWWRGVRGVTSSSYSSSSSSDLTLSHRSPLCSGHGPHQLPGPSSSSQAGTFTTSCCCCNF